MAVEIYHQHLAASQPGSIGCKPLLGQYILNGGKLHLPVRDGYGSTNSTTTLTDITLIPARGPMRQEALIIILLAKNLQNLPKYYRVMCKNR